VPPVLTTLSAAALLAAAPAWAMNRCVTPQGRVLYTEEKCESLGARHEREVRQDGISVVAPVPMKGSAATPADKRVLPGKIFVKSPRAPNLTVCYEAKDARTGVSSGEVESAIQRAFQLWNAGCNVTYEYVGLCPADGAAWRAGRLIDYKVWWASWDESLKSGERTYRDHAIAAASPAIGVALNRDLPVPAHRLQRSIAHEFGHVVGIGHSADPGDLMFSGGKQQTPTPRDFRLCNLAVEARFGVKPAD
jgi:hypothetical protein